MITINFKNIDSKVKYWKSKGVDVFWDGWTLSFFTPAPGGYYRQDGIFRNGAWGRLFKAEVRENGTWKVPNSLVNT